MGNAFFILKCSQCDINALFRFHFAEEAGADEGIEAEVLLALAGFGVNGCIGFGLVQLGFETGLPLLERGKFFERGRMKDLVRLGAGLFETELVLQFFALCRVLLPVARVLYLVGFRLRHAFDAAFGVTIGFAAADGAAFGVRAVQLTDGVFEYCSCHVDIFLVAFFPVAVFPAKREQPNAKLGGYVILYLRLCYSSMSVIT